MGVKIGDKVTFVDENGVRFRALVTWVIDDNDPNSTVNLVYVSADEAATDEYGRQLLRKTTVPHQQSQSISMFWS